MLLLVVIPETEQKGQNGYGSERTSWSDNDAHASLPI